MMAVVFGRRCCRWVAGSVLTVLLFVYVALTIHTTYYVLEMKHSRSRVSRAAGNLSEGAVFVDLDDHQNRKWDNQPEVDGDSMPYIVRSVRDTKSTNSGHRLVHLDLKGAPPKVAYYAELFPFIKRLGATGILIEYEDMFPFWGPLRPIAATNAYSRHDVERIVQLANENELEVIPLIQTFGHLEFVLKLPEFTSLREVASVPQSLCPSRNGSLTLIYHMIDQMLALHPGSKWLHIGCDEVYQLGLCSDCGLRMHQSGWNSFSGKHFLFLDHVRTVAKYIKTKYPGMQTIIWDDMLRNMAQHDLAEYLGGLKIVPMVWVYVAQVYRFVSEGTWRMYSQVFDTVFAAGAFKGAFGSTLFAVNSYRHLECTAEWMRVLSNEGKSFKNGVAGYVLTGWQRYDHFATLCELLPAAVPSLAANLVMLQGSGHLEDSLFRNLTLHLKCSKRFRQPLLRTVAKNPYLWEYSRCKFPGQHFFRLLRTFKQMRSRVRSHVRTITEEQAWLTAYNVRHNYTSPQRVAEAVGWHTELIRSAEKLRDQIRVTLSPIFDRHTISEWLEQHTGPLLEALRKLDSDAHAVMSRDTWPPRPVPSDYDDDEDDD